MTTTATIEDLLSWDPCWLEDGREDELRDSASVRKRWSWRHIVALRGAGVLSDREWLWLAKHFLHHVGQGSTTLRLLAADCAERALLRERAAGREPSERSWTAVAVARRHAAGEATDEQLAAAATAARADAAGVDWVPAAALVGLAAARACCAPWATATTEAPWQCDRLIELAPRETP